MENAIFDYFEAPSDKDYYEDLEENSDLVDEEDKLMAKNVSTDDFLVKQMFDNDFNNCKDEEMVTYKEKNGLNQLFNVFIYNQLGSFDEEIPAPSPRTKEQRKKKPEIDSDIKNG